MNKIYLNNLADISTIHYHHDEKENKKRERKQKRTEKIEQKHKMKRWRESNFDQKEQNGLNNSFFLLI
jgi:hypothetical protein